MGTPDDDHKTDKQKRVEEGWAEIQKIYQRQDEARKMRNRPATKLKRKPHAEEKPGTRGTPQLNIKDADTCRLARELAELTGESQTEAVRKAVRQRLEHEQRLRELASVRSEDTEIADLRAYLARVREEMKPYAASDNDYMYDEFGAPI